MRAFFEKVKGFCGKMKGFVKTHCPAISHEYSVTTKVYKNDGDPLPAYSRQRAGAWRWNIWQALALFVTGTVLLLSLKGKKR